MRKLGSVPNFSGAGSGVMVDELDKAVGCYLYPMHESD
jgi:hypothetical protein